MTAGEIETCLRAALSPDAIEVQDDSHLHAGHAGARDGGHYTVYVTSGRFAGLARLARHRLVYDALGSLAARGVHALAIVAKAPGEILNRPPPSPPAFVLPLPAACTRAATNPQPHPLKALPHETWIPAGAALAVTVAALLAPLAAGAQNIATVNGKAVPKARVDTLLQQATRAGQPVTPELQTQARDQVVLREIFVQEAEKRGIGASPDFRSQMELARQAILIRELFEDYRKKNPITDALAQTEYDKFKAQSAGTEYRARHILVEKEEDAKALIAQLKGGAKFDELAKKSSKDSGSAENGGDLDFAKADSYVPEFATALSQLKKGDLTETPVKTQFGWHVIRLDDTREAAFPGFEEVKGQIKQRLEQVRMQQYQQELRAKAKTDYKFTQ